MVKFAKKLSYFDRFFPVDQGVALSLTKSYQWRNILHTLLSGFPSTTVLRTSDVSSDSKFVVCVLSDIVTVILVVIPTVPFRQVAE